MRYESISNELFILNRKNYTQRLKSKSIAIFNSNDRMPTNADGTMPFRQNSDLFYLSGVDQEESILVLFPDARDEKHREILFLRETSELIAIWEGEMLTKQAAYEVSGIRTVYWLEQFEQIIHTLLPEAEAIYLNTNEHGRAKVEVETRDARFLKWFKDKYPLHNCERSAPIMQDLREIKSHWEVALIQKACDITEKGFRRVLDFLKPGVMEYEVEAEYLHEFVRNGSRGFAYEPIVAGGANSCVLHYIQNDKRLNDGDVLLIDAAAEYANYASDLTRTVPVNGRFTDRQKAVYNAVLRVMKEATNMLRPGTIIKELNDEVGKMIEKELIGLGLFTETDAKNHKGEQPLFKKYFMHGTSHFLGLDVHDVGDFFAPVKPGMVFTCEPGIYIREEGIGVRIENNILVTDDAPKDLMENIPIEVEEIEDLMNAPVSA